ncbi:MAG: DUF4279 domain-containing protein [Oscillospiraceae bacterium]|nr:DUF4279 domain-containing protein [Oscillospiraceae bacterium]
MKNLEKIYYHVEHTNCYTYFRITGDFNPDIISELLCLMPEKFWKTGDTRKNGTKYNFACWQFGTCQEYDVLVENQMLKTLEPLFSKIDILKEIKNKFGVSFTLEVVPTVRFDEPTPCLAPPMKVMQFCCDTGTEIDIDLYISCPDELGNEII